MLNCSDYLTYSSHGSMLSDSWYRPQTPPSQETKGSCEVCDFSLGAREWKLCIRILDNYQYDLGPN